MTATWTYFMPEAGQNNVLNPIAGATGNFSAYNSATVTRDTTQARFGDYSYKIVPGGTQRGINLTLLALANAIHYVTFYAYGATGTLQVALNGTPTFTTAVFINGGSAGWSRYGVVLPAAEASTSTSLKVRNSANETWYLGHAQVEAASYWTTAIHGDLNPLCKWTGLRHGSASLRDAQDRSGGRERDLEGDLGVKVRSHIGTGLAPVTNNTQPMAIQPGAVFESYKVEARTVQIVLDIHGTPLTAFHTTRKAFINAVKPDLVRGAQPIVIGYKGAHATRTIYCNFRYQSGLELPGIAGGIAYIEADAKTPLTLLAESPNWFEDDRGTTVLDVQDGGSSNTYALRRYNGAWQKISSGAAYPSFDNSVYCTLYDPQTGRIYYGGAFTAWDPSGANITVNHICYWDGNLGQMVAMDSGTNGTVYCLALSPNGDLWVGGAQTTVGGAATACKGFARWTKAGAWSVPTATATTLTAVYCLTVDQNNNIVYGGGVFTNFSGDANCDGIFKYTVSTNAFAALGTGITGGAAQMTGLAWHPANGYIYYAGSFTSFNGVAGNTGYWNGTAAVAIAGPGVGGNPTPVAVDPLTGLVYFGTDGLYIWNGASLTTAFTASGGGVIHSLAFSARGLLVGGNYSSVSGLALYNIALWNDYTLAPIDLINGDGSAVSTDDVTAIAVVGDDIYIGTSGSNNSYYAGRATVSPTSTTLGYPTVTVIGPSTANTTCRLLYLANQATDEVVPFILSISAGETITIDFSPQQQPVVSDYRGAILNQPLMNSDDLTLLGAPATNTIACLVDGTLTGVSALMHWTPVHSSIDGVAA